MHDLQWILIHRRICSVSGAGGTISCRNAHRLRNRDGRCIQDTDMSYTESGKPRPRISTATAFCLIRQFSPLHKALSALPVTMSFRSVAVANGVTLPNLPDNTAESIYHDTTPNTAVEFANTKQLTPTWHSPATIFSPQKEEDPVQSADAGISISPLGATDRRNSGLDRGLDTRLWKPRLYGSAHKVLHFLERHWILSSMLFIVGIVSTSMAVGWSLRLSPFQGETWEFNNDRVNVTLQGNLVDVDTDMQTMTIDWYIGLYGCDIEPCPDVNIYFDQGYVVQDSNNSSAPQNNEMPDPVFFLNATDYLNLTDWRQNSPIFRTDLRITNMFTHRSAQAYPFDKYTAVITLWAFTPNMDIVKVYIGWTGGVAVGFNAELDLPDTGIWDSGVLSQTLIITRGQVVRVYAILIVVAIWLVTLTFLMACITNVFFGKGVRGELLVLPVATLFAFTALRGTMPGAPPGFGADIDFMGILPCLALLTFASVFMCAVFLFRSDPGEDTRRWKTMTVDKMS